MFNFYRKMCCFEMSEQCKKCLVNALWVCYARPKEVFGFTIFKIICIS